MLTAEQIRETMPSTADRKQIMLEDEVWSNIINAAAKDRYKIRFSDCTNNEDRFKWINAVVYNRELDNPLGKLIKTLEEHGFKCTNLYEEHQFVDIDVIISWEWSK